jgi:hypothetical protein
VHLAAPHLQILDDAIALPTMRTMARVAGFRALRRPADRHPLTPLSSRAHRCGSHCPSRLGQAAACTTLPMSAHRILRN